MYFLVCVVVSAAAAVKLLVVSDGGVCRDLFLCCSSGHKFVLRCCVICVWVGLP